MKRYSAIFRGSTLPTAVLSNITISIMTTSEKYLQNYLFSATKADCELLQQ